MPIMVERNKWILYKHTSSYDLIKAVALDVKNSCKTDISNVERESMQDRLAALYNDAISSSDFFLNSKIRCTKSSYFESSIEFTKAIIRAYS